MERAYQTNSGPPATFQVVGSPRDLWPREADFVTWLIAHLDTLAACLDVRRLEFTGREVRVGEQWQNTDITGRESWVGGLRLDIAARDERGRSVIVEAQLGSSDHRHLGQVVAYGAAAQTDVVVWAAASRDLDPPFRSEHLAALAELNQACAGHRVFCAVQATVESQRRPTGFVLDDPLLPRLRRIDPATMRIIESHAG